MHKKNEKSKERTFDQKVKGFVARQVISELGDNYGTFHDAYDIIIDYSGDSISDMEDETGIVIWFLWTDNGDDMDEMCDYMETLYSDIANTFGPGK